MHQLKLWGGNKCLLNYVSSLSIKLFVSSLLMIIIKIVLMTYVPHENLLKLFVAVSFLSAGTKRTGNITNISIKSSND